MAPILLKKLNALIQALEGMPTEGRWGGLWLALQLMELPALAPYLRDPLLPLDGQFLSLDSQREALQRASTQWSSTTPTLGMLWGTLYLPAEGRAFPCRVAVMALQTPVGVGWPVPEPVVPVSESIVHTAQVALNEALGLMERVGLPPPRPVHLIYGVEGGWATAGDSLGLPLFLATLSVLTGLPLQPGLGATGALAAGRLIPVDWIEAKREALEAAGIALLSPGELPSLAAAALQALIGGTCFSGSLHHPVPPLVALPTFLSADVEPDGLLGRDTITAFEGTVCAALERHGGFVFRRQAAMEEGIRAAFATVEAACAAAISVQDGLGCRSWPAGQVPLFARIGLYQGSAERVQTGYFGPAPGMATRLMQAAQVGQILLPQDLAAAAQEFTTAASISVISLGQHRLRDLSMSLALCRLDPPDGPICELAPRTLRVRNHNLPLEPNPLLGRHAELTAIRALLESGRRLVTLTGPGGIGKTRLALQLAAELADRFADGVWFVSLVDVRTEEQLDAAIAEALGLEIRDRRVSFIETLAERRMLLVLDNFETVLTAAPRVAQLLRQAPGLICLVTSQILLSLTEEWRFEVAPLVLAEAERLFIERSLQVEPRLHLTDSDLACVRRICERLEGMPLAVELAAVRCRLFTLEEIEARLDNALTLLVTRTRDVPERQRTLRRALEWSFSLLDNLERACFLRLAILPGSFNTEAAKAVSTESEVLEYLVALEDKSLLRREASGRWRMLSIVRQFALECLKKDPPEQNASEEGLLTYCCSIARTSAQTLDTPKELASFKVLEADFDIIRTSIDLMQEQPTQRFVEYFLDLDYFLRRRRYLKELEEWCDSAIYKMKNETNVYKGRLLLSKSFCLREREDNDEALSLINDAIDISNGFNDLFLYADAISFKGIILVRFGEYEQALGLYANAKQIYEKNNDYVRCVRNLNNQSQAKIRLKNFVDAENDLRQALSLGKQIECTRDLCIAVNNMGFLYHMMSNYEEEVAVINDAMQLFINMGDIVSIVALWDNYFKAMRFFRCVEIDVYYLILIIYGKIGLIGNYKRLIYEINVVFGGFDSAYLDRLCAVYDYVDVFDIDGLWVLLCNAAGM